MEYSRTLRLLGILSAVASRWWWRSIKKKQIIVLGEAERFSFVLLCYLSFDNAHLYNLWAQSV